MTEDRKPTEIGEDDLSDVTGGLGPGGLSHETVPKTKAGLRSDGELVQAVSEKPTGTRGITAMPDGLTDG